MEKQELLAIEDWKNKNLKNFLDKGNCLTKDQMDHVFEWLHSEDASRQRKRLYRLSVPDAVTLSEKWVEKLQKSYLNKKEKKLDLNGVEIVKEFEDGFYFVKLIDKESFEREGALMGHCVGNGRYFEAGCTIYSLRDKNNNPHCTIEYSNKSINQIKGKSNLAVIKKYHPYVVEFINLLDFDYINENDCKKFGKISFGGLLIDEDTRNIVSHKSLDVSFLHNDYPEFESIEVNGDLIIENANSILRICDELVVYGDVELTSMFNLKILALKTDLRSNVIIDDCQNIIKNKINCSGEIDYI